MTIAATKPTAQGPLVQHLGAGRGLQLLHGPIDLVVRAEGEDRAVRAAYDRAVAVFEPVLADLVQELGFLRAPVGSVPYVPVGPVARRMQAAATGFDCFVTPMAAVAGAVADHILAAMLEADDLDRAIVNNGGDIAVHLRGDQRFLLGVSDYVRKGQHAGIITLAAKSGVGGVATSGWRGRSHSLGVADAVTVLAATAAEADVLATLIANAVDVPGSMRIARSPASSLAPDSDLGARLVTVDVAPLTPREVAQALDAGAARAGHFVAAGRAISVFIALQGETRIIGDGIAAASLQPNRQLEVI